MSLVILDTTKVSKPGRYWLTGLTEAEALDVVKIYNHPGVTTVSHVADKATAQMLTELLGIKVEVNSDSYDAVTTDVCLCCTGTEPFGNYEFRLMAYRPFEP